MGLIICENALRWPTSTQFLDVIIPKIRKRLTTTNLQWSYTLRSVVLPWRLVRGRAHILSSQLQTKWRIHGSMQDLPNSPRWIINATCYETGRNWRFSKSRMGDYVTNYVLEPTTTIANAISASAAVPGLIGPMTIRSTKHEWCCYKEDQIVQIATPSKSYHLWDGGVYDNLGVEPLFKPGSGFRDGFDFLLVSDASAPLILDPSTPSRRLRPWRRAFRLVQIATEQVRGLRARALIAEFQRNPNSGVYLRIGNTVETIYRAVGLCPPSDHTLPGEDVVQATNFGTTLRRISFKEFELIMHHGFEVANATLATRQAPTFSYKKRPVN